MALPAPEGVEDMGDYHAYTDEEKATYMAPVCDRCGQHRHIVWEDLGEGERHWVPRDAGCSNEACGT